VYIYLHLNKALSTHKRILLLVWIAITGFSFSLFSQTYCVPTVLASNGIGITRFRLNTIDHPSPAGEGMRDTNLTKPAGTATLISGSLAKVVVDLPQSAIVTIWLDYNKNGLFTIFPALERLGVFNGVAGTNTFLVTITGAPLNGTRLRISAGTRTMALSCDPAFPDGDVEDYLVNIIDIDQRCDSLVVTQPQPCCMNPGKVKKEIICIDLMTSGILNPSTLKSITLSTTGTTNMADITKAELWYSGSTNINGAPPNYSSFPNLSNRTLFGSINNPIAPTYTITGNFSIPILPAPTHHYFWLTYDISAAAIIGNTIDATCLNAEIDSMGVILNKTFVVDNTTGLHVIEPYTNRPTSNRGNIWYFGGNAGLDFNCSPPKATADGRMSVAETSTSICDLQGNLKFYTNAETVWDSNHERMANGTGLNGHFLVSHGAQIIPDPGNANEYYLFISSQGADTLFYSKVDMTQNSGLGDVTTKNIFVDEKIQEVKAAVMHCNGKDAWLVALKENSILNCKLQAYLVNSSGVQPPVITNAFTFSGNNSYPGMECFSPNGAKFAFRNLTSTFAITEVRVVDFDNSTGNFCDTLILELDSTVRSISFSSDNSKLYVTSGATAMTIHQFNLNAGSKNAIRSSKTFIATINAGIVATQLGPDGKIYISQAGSLSVNDKVMHTINQPNLSGAFCNLQYNTVNLADRGSVLNLPKFMENYFLDPTYTDLAFKAIFGSDTTACSNDSITFTDSSHFIPTACSPTYNSSWNFGDISSGVSNTSTSTNPKHLFSGPGTYTVSLIINERCRYDTTTKEIIIYPVVTASITGASSICIGDSAILTGSGGTNFQWSTGSTSGSIVIHTPGSSALYSLTVSNGICSDTTSLFVTIAPPPVAVINGDDSICSGTSTLLSASGGVNYLWNTSSTTSSISVNPITSTVYNVTVTTGSCFDTTSFSILVNPSPTAIITGSTSICAGDSVVLSVSGSGNYLWNTSSTNSSITSFPTVPTSYSVIATIGSCKDTANFTVNVSAVPVANAGQDTSLCEGNSVTLNGTGGNNYLWNTGASTASVFVFPTMSTLYSMTTSIGSCVDTDQVMIIINQAPFVATSGNITIAYGTSTTLSANTGVGNTYLWSSALGLSCNTCPNPLATPTLTTKYYVTVTDANGCTAIDSLIIVVDILCPELFVPTAFSPNDDGQNDVFSIKGNCFKTFLITIYDRWGAKVFESTNPTFEWDGKFKSKELDTDVFVYKIEGILTGDEISLKGNISLIR